MPFDTFDQLVKAAQHVVDRPDAYLELEMNSLVFRIHPNRFTGDMSIKLKTFVRLVRALTYSVQTGGMHAVTISQNYNGLIMSVRARDGSQIVVPCEIDRVVPLTGDIQFSVPTLDTDGDSTTPVLTLRKIIL